MLISPKIGVALRKESVDRNYEEMEEESTVEVALRKESVDRNIHTKHLSISVIGRSPQGERG